MKRRHFRDFKSQSVKQVIKFKYRSHALSNDVENLSCKKFTTQLAQSYRSRKFQGIYYIR